jgi:hypothetical protein
LFFFNSFFAISHSNFSVANWLHIAKNENIAYDCEDINDGPWNFVSISHLHDYSKWKRKKKERNIVEIIGCLELLVQAGLNMNKK